MRANAAGNVELLVDNQIDLSLVPISARTLVGISIEGGDRDNVIDLSGVNPTAFSYVDPVTDAPLQILVDGGDGEDVITAPDGLDATLNGGDGNDVITISTGIGALKIDAGDGNDTVTGGLGDNTIIGDDGDDLINGGDGNDDIDAGDGADSVNGGF